MHKQQESNDEFYARFAERLNDINQYPVEYHYKFIVPAVGVGREQVIQIMAQYDLSVSTKESKNGKYISYTAHFKASSADEIIEVYRAVSHVDKVIML